MIQVKDALTSHPSRLTLIGKIHLNNVALADFSRGRGEDSTVRSELVN